MKTALVLFLLLVGYAAPISAQEKNSVTATLGTGAIVTLETGPCTVPSILEGLKDEFIPQFKAGTVLWGSGTIKICLISLPSEGGVGVIDEHGSSVVLPYRVFGGTTL